MLPSWISKQVFLPSHCNSLYIESKLLGNFSYIGFPPSLAPLSVHSWKKNKYRLTISKAAKSPEPKLYSRPVWWVPGLSTTKAGSCLGQQNAGGSKPATVPLPIFLCQSHGGWAACYCQACGPRCVWASGCASVCTASLGAAMTAHPPPAPLPSSGTPEGGSSPSSSSALCLPSFFLLHEAAKLNFIYTSKGLWTGSAGGSAVYGLPCFYKWDLGSSVTVMV